MNYAMHIKYLGTTITEVLMPSAIGLYVSELTGEPYYGALGAFLSACSVPFLLYINGERMRKEQAIILIHIQNIEKIYFSASAARNLRALARR